MLDQKLELPPPGGFFLFIASSLSLSTISLLRSPLKKNLIEIRRQLLNDDYLGVLIFSVVVRSRTGFLRASANLLPHPSSDFFSSLLFTLESDSYP